jgi:CubicO group peptidase (beta-lactamase class C family)
MTGWLEAALDYIPTWLELQLRLTRQPGCSIAIAHRSEVALERAFGSADRIRGEPLTPRHRFRAASHAKTFAAAGILKLAEGGKLQLDDPINKHLGGTGSRIGELTIAQVLCHGAGIIRDGDDCGYFSGRSPYPTGEQLMADFQRPPLIEPGTRFKYSNHGYGLLGLLVEAVTGEPYRSWIKREIIDAIGLAETAPDMPLAAGTPFARGHTEDTLLGTRAVVPGDYSTQALAPASGIVASASDLAKFFAQLAPNAAQSIISAASRAEMTRGRLANPDSSSKITYGYGTVSGTQNGWDWFGHTGGLEGYVSRTKVLPAKELTVCVLANSADAPVDAWINGAIHVLQTFQSRGAPLPALRDWAGRWWGLWGAIDLVPVGDAVIVANAQSATPFLDASELRLTGPDTARIGPSSGFLYYAETARRIVGADGRATELWLGGDRFLSETDRAAEIKQQDAARTEPAGAPPRR